MKRISLGSYTWQDIEFALGQHVQIPKIYWSYFFTGIKERKNKENETNTPSFSRLWSGCLCCGLLLSADWNSPFSAGTDCYCWIGSVPRGVMVSSSRQNVQTSSSAKGIKDGTRTHKTNGKKCPKYLSNSYFYCILLILLQYLTCLHFFKLFISYFTMAIAKRQSICIM